MRFFMTRPFFYRFVYIGKSGSFTPYHKDVLSSYSWSVNVMGAKEWIFVRPGSEENLGIFKTSKILGDYPADVSSKLNNNNNKSSHFSSNSEQMFKLIQSSGNAVFVPTNWHHQAGVLKNN